MIKVCTKCDGLSAGSTGNSFLENCFQIQDKFEEKTVKKLLSYRTIFMATTNNLRPHHRRAKQEKYWKLENY